MPQINHKMRINGDWVIVHLVRNEFTLVRQDFYITQSFHPPRASFSVYTQSENVLENQPTLVGVCDTEDKAYLLARSMFRG